MKLHRLLSMVCAAIMLLMIAGCGNTTVVTENSTLPVSESQATETPVSDINGSSSTEEKAGASVSSSGGYIPRAATLDYPLSENTATLSLWGSISPMLSEYLDDWNDQAVVQELEKATGIHLDFRYYSPQAAEESFNLMIASGEYPDMIQGFANSYSQGLDHAIEEEIIITLNDIIEKNAPDYMAALADNNMIESQYTDSGHIAGVQGFESAYTGPMNGPMIRSDWLSELGLEEPSTYDEYYDVLKAFKTEYDCSAPLLLTGNTQNANWLVGGYGVAGYTETTMYQIDGTVYSSLTQEAYKEYIQMISIWYEEGLIHPDFYTIDSSIMNANTASYLYSGSTGIFYGMTTQMPTYLSNLQLEEGSINAIQDARVSEGEKMHFGGYPIARSGQQISISTDCNDPELALRWINYGFTQEGYWLLNYGIAGVSYNLDTSGMPVMTDIVTNSDSFNVSIGMGLYTWPQIPCLQDAYRNYNTIFTETQKNTWDTWMSCIDGEYELPGDIALTAEESSDYALIMADIQTYCDTQILKFVIGDLSFDEWDSFVAELKSFGIDDCVKIYQDAYNRYLER